MGQSRKRDLASGRKAEAALEAELSVLRECRAIRRSLPEPLHGS